MVYILNIISEIIFGVLILNSGAFMILKTNNTKMLKNKKLYIIICGFLWILISSLRNLSIGSDTYSYFLSFENVKQYSFSYLLNKFYQKYILGMSIKDPGYDVFVKLFQYIIDNYRIFLLFVACFFMFPFCRWVCSESRNPVISFTLYSCLFYAFFSITGIRQTIATSIVVLFGDRFIKKRKLVPFIVLIFLASTIHASALVFLPFYYISEMRICKRNLAIWIILIILSVFGRRTFKSFFIQLSGYEEYAQDYMGAGSNTFSTLMILIFFWSIFSQFRDHFLEENKRKYNALYLAIFFLPLTWLNPSAMRVVQYYSLYLVLLIPEMIDSSFTSQSKKIASFIIMTIFVLFLIKSNPTYTFFWN